MKNLLRHISFAAMYLALVLPPAGAWQAVEGHIMTPWAHGLTPDNVHSEYPRPMMVRETWRHLNGLWNFAIQPKDDPAPAQYEGQILVPFPVESALSGVKRRVGGENRVWYHRTFTVPEDWQGQRVLLHFGAVDWEAVVTVNGREVGSHRGGYDPFHFDITEALRPAGQQTLVVSVWDPSDDGPQPRGKQVKEPGGIWYTPVTGIWQTPWLEPVALSHIESLKITPDFDNSAVTIQARGFATGANPKFQVEILEGDRVVQQGSLETMMTTRSIPPQIVPSIKLAVPEAKPWTPDTPHLYDLRITLWEDGRKVDEVTSYFGMRKISLARDEAGVLRMQLNNQNVFQFGPLDQGWWPDGLYTAPSDEALRFDIEMTKKLGFNMARKHVKVEPARWYYWCDKLGLLVWQDMPSGDKSAEWRGPSGVDGREMVRTPESRAIYEKEWKAIMDANHNHPCIVVWVPFNEGWGQFDTVRILNWTMEYDPTRLVDGASGGNHFPAGHIIDHHQYPGPGAPRPVTDRAMVLGEFGGLGLPLPGHTWQQERNWGYRNYQSADEVAAAYKNLLRKLHPMIGANGLSAAIYTQTTDVEVEVNGLMTYDRVVVKLPAEKIADANRKLYGPPPLPPVVTVLSPSSQSAPQEWAYTTDEPAENWVTPGFDDAAWKRGPGGFGTENTPNTVVRTVWNTPGIWMRRSFDVAQDWEAHELQLHIHHDEDARVFLNGQLIAELRGYLTAYDYVILDDRAARALKKGRNLLAVQCLQTGGGQYIDVGLVDVQERLTPAAAAVAPTRAPDSQTSSAANHAGPIIQADAEKQFRVPVPDVNRDGLYVQNRAPLVPAPFMKLPIGSVTPRGWLRGQLELQAHGMSGRLTELSPWLDFEKSSWASPDGAGSFGWEEMPYWLKGYGDLAYVLKDETMISEARRWIEAILRTQREDGYYGPRMLLTSLKGQPDLWPHMIVNNILQSWHEYSADDRVIPFLLKYHRWLHAQPPSIFRNGYWPHLRWGDNLETCHWLYNRTGQWFLLDLAERIHTNMAAWREGIVNWHNVNLAQGFRAPGVFFSQSGVADDLSRAEANYQEIMGRYGQFAGGGFAGDENCRPGHTDPRQAFETCGIVEFMHSFEMLTKISGDSRWADRAEDIALNSFPAAVTPDWKALHYLTAANQVQLDRHNKAPVLQNGGTMVSYSPFEVYRCCQHNVAHGWPYYAEELWLATHDRGLAASLYAPSTVTVQVAEGTQITIDEETDYPFDDNIRFTLHTPKTVAFPWHFRIPSWADKARLKVNGRTQKLDLSSGRYAVVDRDWEDGTVVELRLPMEVRLRHWERNHNSISVDYGPLTFSLRIEERWEKYGDRDAAWPEWEVFPDSPWNYGLELKSRRPERSFDIIRRKGPVSDQPFTPDSCPLSMRVKARRIPAWQMDRLNMVGKLQPSPVKSAEATETISLIPMGAARLRISSFPVISDEESAHEWTLPQTPPVTASFNPFDGVEAMVDGIEPRSSIDDDIPRFTWWDHRGTEEWVEWGFEQPKQVSEVQVYWFDDTGRGECRVPESWRVLYRAGERWHPVEQIGTAGTVPDQYNRVSFRPVLAEGLRLEVKLQPHYSAGILEWKAK